MNKEDIRCNHNPNDIENSLRMIKKMEMVYPQKYYFQCEECRKLFTFCRDNQTKAFKECD